MTLKREVFRRCVGEHSRENLYDEENDPFEGSDRK